MAIFSNLVTTFLKPFPLVKPLGHVVLAAVGTIQGIKVKIFCLSTYLPPNLRAPDAQECLEYNADVVAEAKITYMGCTIILAGDFNAWRAELLVEERPYLVEVIHGPTIGERVINRTFVIFSRAIEESGTMDPLEDKKENVSDHKTAYLFAEMKKEKVKSITSPYRFYSKRRGRGFKGWMDRQDWNDVSAAADCTSKAQALQSLLRGAMDVHFLFKITTRSEKDPP